MATSPPQPKPRPLRHQHAGAAAKPELNVRADFPILGREIDGHRLVYLDSAATSQKPRAVIDAMSGFYAEHNASVHRGVYRLAEEATALFEGARERIAAFTGSQAPTTIFTRNATEAINLVAYAWGRSAVGAGDVVLTCVAEHHSNLVPWQLLCAERGAELRYLEVDGEGRIDLGELAAELERGSGRVRLLALAHVSNVLGTIHPVAEAVALARAAGACTLIDGSQAAPALPLDVAAIDADFYVWTGHKTLGPTGIGVLHGRREILEAMGPFLTGGDMIRTVDFQEATWNELPWKFEAGTSMVAEAVGLGAAVDYLGAIGMDAVRSHERSLTAYALERLGELDGLRVFGPRGAEWRGGLVSFALDGIHPHDIAEIANRSAVCIRAGHHCAQPLMRRLGVGATARASFGPYNGRDDVDDLVDALVDARAVFA